MILLRVLGLIDKFWSLFKRRDTVAGEYPDFSAISLIVAIIFTSFSNGFSKYYTLV